MSSQMRKDLEKYKQERLGETNVSNEGYEMKIIQYNNANDIWIEFQDENKVKVHTSHQAFKKGDVKNPYHKCVFNIGYLGQGKCNSKKNLKAYHYWKNLLKRCYDPYFLNKEPTYIDCYVCEEWHCFQNFAEWFYKHYYEVEGERMQLDKDILVKGNKIYSPETCIFVPQRINNLFTKNDSCRGIYPIGVTEYYDKKCNYKVLQSICSVYDKEKEKKTIKHLGYFSLDKPFQAFTVYKNFKEKYIKQIADEYKDKIPTKLYEAMYKYEIEIND